MTISGAEAIERLVLDTSAYSQLRSGHTQVIDLVARAGIVLMPVVVLGELEAAFEVGSRATENRVALTDFLAEPFVSVLTTTHEVARRYGEIFGRLRRAGTPIPVNDIWIAATTLDCGGHLLTFDRDFQRVETLRCTVISPD